MLPNFLIIGAPKCGTTSLFNYLNQHPQIFLPQLKEPHFFSKPYKNLPFQGPGDNILGSTYNMNMTFDDYKKLFPSDLSSERVGEASADYMYYNNCAKDIHEVLGDINIIAILRNPVDRAISAYAHMRRNLVEQLNFEEAIKLEQDRINKNWDFMWHYTAVGLYYNQLKHYFSKFSKIHVIKYEDFSINTREELSKICKFLDVDNDFLFDTALRHNISGIPTHGLLQRFLINPSPIGNIIVKIVPRTVRRKVSRNLLRHNLQKPNVTFRLKNNLMERYKEDIKNTQELTGLDLTDWIDKYSLG